MHVLRNILYDFQYIMVTCDAKNCAAWKYLPKLISMQTQIRVCRVEISSEINKSARTIIRNAIVTARGLLAKSF